MKRSLILIVYFLGHMTITLGRKYDPAKIVGLDIDRKLVEIARKNIRHYMDTRCEKFELFVSTDLQKIF